MEFRKKQTEDLIKGAYKGMKTVSGTTAAYQEGQKQATKGRYFNPYSIATQRQQHNDFEAGWKSKQVEMHPDEVITRTKNPQLGVLILGILLAALMYFAFF